MKNDLNGCSTCQAGSENYENFMFNNKPYFQYDYRHTNGDLFSTIAPTLEKCREKRDNWLNQK